MYKPSDLINVTWLDALEIDILQFVNLQIQLWNYPGVKQICKRYTMTKGERLETTLYNEPSGDQTGSFIDLFLRYYLPYLKALLG